MKVTLPPDAEGPVFAARRAPSDRHPSRTPVTHPYAALAFYTGGRARIEQRGHWMLEPGDVLVVPAGEPHRLIEARRQEFWGLGLCVPCFAGNTCDAGDNGSGLLEPFERVRSGASAVVRIPTERHAFLEGLFRELEEASGPRWRGQPPAVQRSLLTLISNEVRRAAGWEAGMTGMSGMAGMVGPQGVVAESLHFIERNCLRPLTLREVAREVGRSEAYVTTALKRATGRSAVEWIIFGRMAEARRLLLHSGERIETISERVGYADPTHFIRLFQRLHGATPAAWRMARSLSRQ